MSIEVLVPCLGYEGGVDEVIEKDIMRNGEEAHDLVQMCVPYVLGCYTDGLVKHRVHMLWIS